MSKWGEPGIECVICLEGNEEDDNTLFIICCGHPFHYQCLIRSYTHPACYCPICRSTFTQRLQKHSQKEFEFAKGREYYLATRVQSTD